MDRPQTRDADARAGREATDPHDAIAVVDFGGQYAHLIATKVRRSGVLAEIRQPEDPVDRFRPYRGIILSGSPSLSSHGEDSAYTKEIFDLDVPILGFCFGHQEIAKHYGGEVVHGGREWGPADLRIPEEHALFAGLQPSERVWMSHYDSVSAVGPAFVELGYTTTPDGSPEHRYAAIGSDRLRRYGFQFHPEVDDTEHGDEMISNFVFGICGCRRSWDMDAFLDAERARIRDRVGDRSVFLLASGGVDSTVAALVLGESLGPDRVELLHIDSGLMRKDESAEVLAVFDELGLGGRLHFVDASDEFLAALDGLVDPEAKREAIGDAFIRVFDREAERLGVQDHLLGQGTIYPDTIETGGTKRADTIKTHHNRVAVIEEMIAEGRVVEPLAELYKVEVRELGERLGVPRHVLGRHPFPGPGLGVRLLCSDGGPEPPEEGTEEALAEAVEPFGLEALALPIRSVGVKADLRAYEHPVLLSAPLDLSGATTETGSTESGSAGPSGPSDHSDGPEWRTILDAASTVTARVPGINRCLWNLGRRAGPDAPRSARPVRAHVTRERLALLREVDHLVMEGLRRHGLYDEVWQCPTVLVPLALDESRDDGSTPEPRRSAERGDAGRAPGELVVLRPVRSQRAMTATPVELPAALIDELRRAILPLPGVGALALDVTSKPPGTIEWE